MPQDLRERITPALNARDRAIQLLLTREPTRVAYQLLAAHYERAGLRGLAGYYRDSADALSPDEAPLYPAR